MLRLSGNSEYAFASENSINANPLIYAEWNYNTIHRPFLIASSSTAISSNISDYNSWTSSNGGDSSMIRNAGFQSVLNPTASAIDLKLSNVKTDVYSSASVSVSPGQNKYYKFAFYVKANQPIYSGQNLVIPATAIESTPVNAASAAIALTAYYRIAQLTRNGAEAFPDFDDEDVEVVRLLTGQSSVKLNWDALTYRGPLYNIYRSISDIDKPLYLTTIPAINQKIQSINPVSGSFTCNFYFAGTKSSNIAVGSRFGLIGTVNANDGMNADNLEKFRTKMNRTRWEVTAISASTNSDGDPITIATASPSSSVVQAYVLSIGASSVFCKKIVKNGKETKDFMKAKFGFYEDTVTYEDILTPTDRINSFPVKDDKIRVMPSVRLSRNGNLLENSNMYVKVYENETDEADISRGMIDIDGISYKKIEIYFGSQSQYDSIKFDLSIDSSYGFANVYICQPTLYAIDQWEFFSSQEYPIDSLFNSHRPGEALLNPYLQDDDRLIYKDTITKNSIQSGPKNKKVSYAVFNPDLMYDYSMISPFKQMHSNHMNNIMRYYVSDKQTGVNTPNTLSISAIYNDYMSINKLVVKGIPVFMNLQSASGNIVLLQASGSTTVPFVAGDFDGSGLLDLYYNGSSWSKTQPTDGTYPPKLTDSGLLQNVIENVKGIVFNIDDIPNGAKFKSTRRIHILEISPRLEIDISGLVQTFAVSKSMDDEQSAAGFPMSYINANSGTIEISNIPVYRDTLPSIIFDDISENATFYNLMKHGVKFTGALISSLQDFTEKIPMFTMYADTWSVSDIKSVTVNMFDSAKYHLMAIQAPDYFGENEGMFSMLTNVMDVAGFSDYDFDGLKDLTKNRSQGTSHFWCDRTITLFEALKSFFAAHQIGAFFDEYGIMRFIDIDKIIDNYLDETIDADFAVTDIAFAPASSSITYIPNIMSDTYSHNLAPKIGKVSLQYQVPIKAFTDDVNVGGARMSEQNQAVWTETGNSALISSFANKSMLHNESYFSSNPDLTQFFSHATTPRHSLGTMKGMAFIGGELIDWNGFEYTFNPYTKSNFLTFNASAVVSSASPFSPTASIVITSASAEYEKSADHAKIEKNMLVNGEYISSDTFVKSFSTKNGPKVKVTGTVALGSTASNSIFVSTASSASTVNVNAFVKGAGINKGTYVSAKAMSGSTTFLTLSKPPTKSTITASFQSSSVTLILNKNSTINGTASTAASVVNFSPDFLLYLFSNNSDKVNNPKFKNSMTAIISDTTDINRMVMDYSNQDTRISGLTYNFTGRVFGVARGRNSTSKRNHLLIDDVRPPDGFYRSTNYFDKKFISATNTFSGTLGSTSAVNSNIVFDNNIARIVVKRARGNNPTYPVLLTPKSSSVVGNYLQPTSASSFNYFSFVFSTESLKKKNFGSDDKTIVELGLFVSTTQGNLMFCLANDGGETYLKSSVGKYDPERDLSKFVFGPANKRDTTIVSSASSTSPSNIVEWKRKVKNVFDGKTHRFSILFHDGPDVSDMSALSKTGARTYAYCTFMIDSAEYGPFKIYHVDNVNSGYKIVSETVKPKSTFGFYAKNTNQTTPRGGNSDKPFAINLKEIYACDWWDNKGHQIVNDRIDWHWQSPTFLNNIMDKVAPLEPNYYYWGVNRLTGVKIYENVPFTTSPVIEEKLELHFDGYDPGNQETINPRPTLGKTSKKSLSISRINSTPFRVSFALANKTNQLVFLSVEGDTLDSGTLTPLSLTATYNKLTEPITLEKVIDASSIGNSIQLSTKWVQSGHDAKVLLDKIALLATAFNNEISVSIFGNPLIQVGDICQFVYSLKNIGYDPLADGEKIIKKMFLVKSVNQNYGGGLQTSLTLKPLFQIPQ